MPSWCLSRPASWWVDAQAELIFAIRGVCDSFQRYFRVLASRHENIVQQTLDIMENMLSDNP
jgi:hypothetical protein